MNPVTSTDIRNRCGKCSHDARQQCPARETICRKCHKYGHFQVVCQTRTVKVVSAEDSDDNSFIGVIEQPESLIISTVSTGSEPWTVTISLNQVPIEFQIDTGADVSIISEQLFKKLKLLSLEPTTKSLIGPSASM